jgi:hypothetical protein
MKSPPVGETDLPRCNAECISASFLYCMFYPGLNKQERLRILASFEKAAMIHMHYKNILTNTK